MKITSSFLGAVLGLSLATFASVASAQTTGGIVSCSIEATRLSSGQIELTWGSANAMFAAIDNGVGTVSADGKVIVSPQSSTTYNLHVWNAQGVNGYCSTSVSGGTVLGASTSNPVVTIVTNSVSSNPQIISLNTVPYTGAEDYVYSLFALALVLSAFYGVSESKRAFALK